MKILHVIDQISQKTAGGSAKVCYQLALAQASMGHDVAIYTSDYHSRDDDDSNIQGITKFRCYLNLLGSFRITPGFLFADWWNYDIIHLHNYRTFQSFISAFFPRPFILEAHGNSALMKGKLKVPFDWIFGNTILKRANRLIADAPSEGGNYIFAGAKPERIEVIPVGIDLTEFDGLPPRQLSDKKRILFLGRLHESKGVDLLIDAFAELHRDDCVLQIAGNDAGAEADLKNHAAQYSLNGRIQFLGGLYGKDKLQAYVNADVFVMPSRYEMWGLTFMEALACGTPVVMTRNCEAAKVLPSYCGLAVPFDAVVLRRAIMDVLYRPTNFWDDTTLKRVEWVRQYSWENIAKRIDEVYQEVLG